jgi:eukaryotic-like serine/threonine-protein kinase
VRVRFRRLQEAPGQTAGFERSLSAGDPEPEAEPPEGRRKREHASWEFEEGTEIAPGRTTLKALGGGSAYEVYLVWDERLFAIMVAKVVRPDQVEDDHTLKDLRREAEALERLAHPVLVRGFDAVLDGPQPHLLLEHLEGPTLRRLIKKGGTLPMQQVLPLALHVAAALHYMAEEQMVHLDTKPDNIVMGVPPRLIDLSVARSFERARRISGAVGTDAYMAPEQCDPGSYPGRIGDRTDVWGLAATVWHAVAGTVPFPRPKDARESPDPGVRFPQLTEEPEPLPSRVPEELSELLRRGLRKEPEERPSAADLARGLEPLVAALPRKLRLSRRGSALG